MSLDTQCVGLGGAAFVPGLPHLLSPKRHAGHKKLADAIEALGDALHAKGVKRLLYYSTQWLSVLGQAVQAKAELRGDHVDENWHDVVDMPFSFQIDQNFAKLLAANAEAAGYQTKLIDYEGFPVDTGTIVADTLLNKGRFKTNMVACSVYLNFANSEKFGSALAGALAADPLPTAAVAVSMLSGRFFTTEIDWREDQISSQNDDQWNQRILSLCTKGAYAEMEALVPEYAAECKVDMGFKAYAFLKGLGAIRDGHKAQVRAYDAIYGTGAAVIEW